jgi:hypothetical protein
MDLHTLREQLAAYVATGRTGIVLPAAELLAALDQAERDRADHVARLAYSVHLALLDHDLVLAEKHLHRLFRLVCVTTQESPPWPTTPRDTLQNR